METGPLFWDATADKPLDVGKQQLSSCTYRDWRWVISDAGEPASVTPSPHSLPRNQRFVHEGFRGRARDEKREGEKRVER